MRNVHEQHAGIVDRMHGVRRMAERRVVLEIDARQAALRLRQQLVLVVAKVGERLEQDAVEGSLAHAGDRTVMDVRAPRQATPAAAVTGR